MIEQDSIYKNLFLEMEEYEKRGVGIFMNDAFVSPLIVADTCAVHEDCNYMRDYIIEGDTIREIRFNSVFSM